MLTSDIHKAFKVIMDKNAEAVSFGGCPAFLPEEIDLFLNQAYIEIICNKYTGQNSLNIAFEGSVKRIQDLEGLVKTDKDQSIVSETDTNRLYLSNLLNGSDNRMFFVGAVLHWTQKTDISGSSTNWTAGKERKVRATTVMIDHSVANRFLETYSNKPWIETPVATIEDNTLWVYIDTVNMKGPYTVDITYVKYPDKIDHNTPNVEINEVPDRILYEVINRAVVLALENIESKRSETKLNINNLSE